MTENQTRVIEITNLGIPSGPKEIVRQCTNCGQNMRVERLQKAPIWMGQGNLRWICNNPDCSDYGKIQERCLIWVK